MSEFTYLFRGRQIPTSPEQRQKHLEKWVAWFKDLNGKGVIKNPGHPLEDTGKVVNGSQKTVKDGPFAEAKDVVAGFIVREVLGLDHDETGNDILGFGEGCRCRFHRGRGQGPRARRGAF